MQNNKLNLVDFLNEVQQKFTSDHKADNMSGIQQMIDIGESIGVEAAQTTGNNPFQPFSLLSEAWNKGYERENERILIQSQMNIMLQSKDQLERVA